MTSVSTVIPTWNGRHLLEEFLPSVIDAAEAYRQTTGADVEIVVVDDGSTDDTVRWLAMQADSSEVPLRVIARQTNGGFGVACNDGFLAARHPLVLLVNNDVAVDAAAMAPLAARFEEKDPSSPLFAVHGRVRDFDTGAEAGTGQLGGFRRGFIRMHESYVTRSESPGGWPSMFASGGSSMIDRALFLELGGFDPLFAPFYFEDVELSYRAWKRGLAVKYEPSSEMRHRFSSTIRQKSSAGQIRRISQRNRLFLNWIHLHDRFWFLQHAAWVALIFVTSPLTMRLEFARAVVDALGRLPEVRERRRNERLRARRRDRDVMRIFDELRARPGVQVRT